MTKETLLGYLADTGGAEAAVVAHAFGEPYSTTAMSLLRLSRQGLVERFPNPATGCYEYRLTHRGESRLAFLESHASGDSYGP